MFTKLTAAAAIAILPLLASTAPGGAQSLTSTTPSCSTPNVAATTLYAADPVVPVIFATQGLTGAAVVQVDIDAEGHVLNASIAKTSGTYVLDLAAIRAARGSEFRPQVVDCVSVPGSYLFEVNFG